MQQNPFFRQSAWTYEPHTTSVSPFFRPYPDYLSTLTQLYIDYLPEQPMTDFPMFQYKYNFPSEYELTFKRQVNREKYAPRDDGKQPTSSQNTSVAATQKDKKNDAKQVEIKPKPENLIGQNQYLSNVASSQNALMQQRYGPFDGYDEYINKQYMKNNCPQSLDYKANLPSYYQDKFYDDVHKEKNSQLSQGRQAYLYQPDYIKNYQERPQYQDFEDFFNIFCQMLELEAQCEQLKVLLFMEPTFTMRKLWVAFDRIPKTIKAKNVIIHEEFVKGCQFFRFNPDPFDIKLLMSKYQASNDVFTFYKNVELNFQDLANIFYPLSKGDLFRGSMNQPGKDEKFGHCEFDLVEQLLKLMASQEDVYEYNKKLIKQRNIDLERIYYQLNTDRNYKLTPDELRSHLILRNILYSNDELIPLFRRFDRDNKGYISLEDFILMMEPRIQLANRRPIQNEIQKILYGDDE